MVSLQPKFREEQVAIITSFIRHHLEDSGANGLVVGMSGGVDSSLVAKLCVEAVGRDKVVGVWSGEGPAEAPDHDDARDWARALGISLRTYDIAPLVASFGHGLEIKGTSRVALGNVKARVRMIILYYIANTEGRLVMGTGNKSEIAMGYFTVFGDGGADFLPIGDLYKTQVREMASFLGLPKRIIDKVPTAGLWPGQTDEGELGMRPASPHRRRFRPPPPRGLPRTAAVGGASRRGARPSIPWRTDGAGRAGPRAPEARLHRTWSQTRSPESGLPLGSTNLGGGRAASS